MKVQNSHHFHVVTFWLVNFTGLLAWPIAAQRGDTQLELV